MRFLEALQAMDFQTPKRAYDWALGTAITLSSDGPSRLLLAQLRFGCGQAPEPRSAILYPTAELWEDLLPPNETWESLTNERQESILLGTTTIAWAGPHWNAHYLPTESWPRWLGMDPCYYVSTAVTPSEQLARPTSLARIPVAKGGERCFANTLSACGFWFNLGEIPRKDNSRLGTLEVLCPLLPGYVCHLEQDRDGCFRVHLVSGLDNTALRVTVAWDQDGRTEERTMVPEADCAVFEDVPSGPFGIYVFRAGDLIAHFQGAEHAIEQPTDVVIEDDLRTMVLGGESEVCEFKTVPHSDPRKWRRDIWDKLLREICALANMRGGHLLLGVTDETEIIGINGALEATADKNVPSTRSAFESLLRKWMQERLAYKPRAEAVWATIDDKQVFALNIYPNPPGNVCTLNDRIYVRSGSSSRPATVEEQRALLCSDAHGHSSRGFL
jgi:hypothetical protein